MRLRQSGKILAFMICMVIFCSFLPTLAYSATFYNDSYTDLTYSISDDFDTKMEKLEAAFPNNWYWNSWPESKLNGSIQRKVTINGLTTYISQKSCYPGIATANSADGHNHDKGRCYSSEFDSKWQCHGFGCMLFYLTWGYKTNKGKLIEYSDDAKILNYLRPGDILRTAWPDGHTIFITKITNIYDANNNIIDKKIEYVDCNGDDYKSSLTYRCRIVWRRSKKLSEISIKSTSFVVLSHDPVNEPVSNYAVVSSTTDTSSGHIYTLYSGSTTWPLANDYAASLGDGYQLATMDNSSIIEQTIIETLVDSFGYACWLGANDLDGNWKWSSGEVISLNDARWASGQPSGSYNSSNEHYLGIYANNTQTSYAEKNKWNDFSINSNTIKGFIIEYTPSNSSSINTNLLNNCIYLPDSIKMIGSYAFENVSALCVYIPETVEYIDDNAFTNSCITVILGHSSYVEEYAIENGFDYYTYRK